jgi:hypothetical protein
MKFGKLMFVFLLGVPFLMTLLFTSEVYRFYATGRTLIPQIGILIGFFNPPDDYFMSRGNVDMCSKKCEYIIEYEHKYYGGYFLEMKFPRDMEVTEKIKSGLSFECCYYDKKGEMVRQTATSNIVLHSNGQGKIFGIIDKYNVPNDLSIDEIWNLVVCVKGDAKALFKNCPIISLSIEKSSDE